MNRLLKLQVIKSSIVGLQKRKEILNHLRRDGKGACCLHVCNNTSFHYIFQFSRDNEAKKVYSFVGRRELHKQQKCHKSTVSHPGASFMCPFVNCRRKLTILKFNFINFFVKSSSSVCSVHHFSTQ